VVKTEDEVEIVKKIAYLFGKPNFGSKPKGIRKLKQLRIMDPANVCMIISKTPFGKKILSIFVREDDTAEKIMHDIKEMAKFKFRTKKEIKARYSVRCLKPALNILELCTDWESVEIQMRDDFPIKLSNEHFDIILAPIVEG